jgi:catechol 2,3-dioxygenase-like lactoylglutathione lyase family enzyme
MNALNRFTLAIALGLSLQPITSAPLQLIPASDAPLYYIHHHLYVSSIDAQMKFWVAMLGATPVGKFPNTQIEVVKFPNVFVSLTPQTPTGGTKGSTVNHIGFQVRDIRATIERLRAGGYPIVTRAEVSSGVDVKDDLAYIADQDTHIAYVMAPDEIKVEFVENRSMDVPILSHHVHFAAPDVEQMKAWYVTLFRATPGRRGLFQAADIPGVNLTFSPASGAVLPTRGRALDHIGIEIKSLDRFCKDVEARGIKFDRPYSISPATSFGSAIMTDPWGTRVELTEGYEGLFLRSGVTEPRQR